IVQIREAAGVHRPFYAQDGPLCGQLACVRSPPSGTARRTWRKMRAASYRVQRPDYRNSKRTGTASRRPAADQVIRNPEATDRYRHVREDTTRALDYPAR